MSLPRNLCSLSPRERGGVREIFILRGEPKAHEQLSLRFAVFAKKTISLPIIITVRNLYCAIFSKFYGNTRAAPFFSHDDWQQMESGEREDTLWFFICILGIVLLIVAMSSERNN